MSATTTTAAQQGEDSGKILFFPQGIPGFEDYTRYTIFHKEDNEISIYWLESVDSPKVTFTLVDPTSYGLHYTLDLTDQEQNLLEADDPNSLAVMMMLSKPEVAGETEKSGLNANITGPIVLNLKSRRGLQKVLTRAKVNVNIIGD